MHITSGLGVYWSSPQTAQIGLDPQIGIGLANCSQEELRFIDSLTIPNTLAEIKKNAATHGISTARMQEILESLEKSHVLDRERPASPDGDAWWRIHHELPVYRSSVKIEIPRLDYLGCALAIALAEAGIQHIYSADDQRIGEFDHFQLRSHAFGLPRRQGIISLLRQINPHIKINSGKKNTAFHPHIAIISGSHTLDPLLVGKYLASGITCLQCWVEEVNIYVGTLVSPHQGTCGNCFYRYRCEAEPNWPYLAPQALVGRPVIPELSGLQIATSLAVRELLNFIDFSTTQLRQAVWRIPPAPQKIELISLPPHPECGCTTRQSKPKNKS